MAGRRLQLGLAGAGLFLAALDAYAVVTLLPQMLAAVDQPIDRIEQSLKVFRQTTGRPTFLILDSHIGYGSPNKQDTPEAHGTF